MKKGITLILTMLFLLPLLGLSEVRALEKELNVIDLKMSEGKSQNEDSITTIKMMSFNVLADRSTWRDRRGGIADKILEINPDIVGLQEAMSTQRRDLTNLLQSTYDLVEFDIPVTYGNPILLRKDQFTILDSGFVEATECGNTRYINWLLLRENDSNKEFYFYNNHFCVSPSQSQEEQAIELVQLMNQHQITSEGERSAIAVGDFNSSRYRTIMRFLLDQTPIGDESNPVELVDSWEVINPTISKPPTHQRGGSIDWILTLTDEVISEATVDDSDGFSDHFPVTATFDF
ncbi:endonuclease/exonuclease/phosphatase family protein [Bacillus sp. 2205SS5-2]|uniref:endonuclease/exonuclease/phosphatase family protein n=1 Tax=Bacillus sp. 2205SS5-2 TaxID=3109031 RepID=UPI003004D2CD